MDADVTPTGPLAGVKVLELTGLGPGPFACMMLAELGADVVRVDRPGGSPLTVVPPEQDLLTLGRPVVTADLKSPEGVALVLDLVEKADVIVEGFRPGVTERLGLGPEVCLERNPALVYARMTGWGQDGPMAPRVGHDINYISLSGGLGSLGQDGGRPAIPLNLLGDFGGGSLYLVTGILAALLHARSTGEGQVVDAAITDGVAHLMTMAVAMHGSGVWDGGRGTSMLGGAQPDYDVYETADGGWLAVGALEPQFWAETLRVLELEVPDRRDPANHPAIREALSARIKERTRAEWEAAFDGVDACVTPVLTLEEAYAHPHNVARGSYASTDSLIHPGAAPRFSGTPTTSRAGQGMPQLTAEEALARWA